MKSKSIFLWLTAVLLMGTFSTCKKGPDTIPSTTFFKEYGDWVYGLSIEYVYQMPDNGFLLAGSGGIGGYVPLLVRTTKYGTLLWKREMDNDPYSAYFFMRKNDGSLIASSYVYANNPVISKIDTLGNVLAHNTFYHIPGYNFICAFGGIQTSDGNNLFSNCNGAGQGAFSDNYVIKYDDNLNLIDSVNIPDYSGTPGKTLNFNVYQAQRTGWYYAWGNRYPKSPFSWGTNTYLYVAKVAPPRRWVITEIDTSDKSGSYIPEWCIENSDSSLAILGQRTSNLDGTNSVSLSCIDKNLKLLWHHYYPEPGASIGVWEMASCSDGGYIVSALASVGSGSPQPYALRLDKNGHKIWSKIFNFSGNVQFNAVTQTSDGGFAFAGYTTSFGSGKSNQVVLLKTDANGKY